jgi:hypothetical protein
MPVPPPVAAPAASVRPAPGPALGVDLLPVALAAGLIGTLLGVWCRSWTDGAAGYPGAVVADLGAPWIMAAFATGVAVGGRRPVALEPTSRILAGVLAGGGALALGSLVYYAGSTGPRAVFWMGLGLVVGGVAGGAGAAWATWPRSAPGAAAATALGLAVAAEGVARLGGGLWMASNPTADLTVLGVIGLGVVLPLLLARGRALGLVGSLGVLTLAVPTAAVLAATPAVLSLAISL